jgi:hypothetical protein
METAAAEQNAAIKCCSEECLTTSRAFPVRQPGSKEKVGDKSEREEKTGNVKGESDFENCRKEKTKHHEPAPAIRSPGVRILWIHPKAPGFARAFLQFRHLHDLAQTVPERRRALFQELLPFPPNGALAWFNLLNSASLSRT